MVYTFIVPDYLLRRSKSQFHSHRFIHGWRLCCCQPVTTRTKVGSVSCPNFDIWMDKVVTKPAIFRSEVDRSTSAPQIMYWSSNQIKAMTQKSGRKWFVASSVRFVPVVFHDFYFWGFSLTLSWFYLHVCGCHRSQMSFPPTMFL